MSINNQPLFLSQHAKSRQSARKRLAKKAIGLLAGMSCIVGIAAAAKAEPPLTQTPNNRYSQVESSEDYQRTVIYTTDPDTLRLEPRPALVATDEPIADAIEQIMQDYQGQDIGIDGYEVRVDPETHQAEIDFKMNNPKGAEAFDSLSSANRYALFEAIRETLVTEPVYGIENVTFSAEGTQLRY